jgi:hypothetical protein
MRSHSDVATACRDHFLETIGKPARVRIQVPIVQMVTLLPALQMPWEPAIPTAWNLGGGLRPNVDPSLSELNSRSWTPC